MCLFWQWSTQGQCGPLTHTPRSIHYLDLGIKATGFTWHHYLHCTKARVTVCMASKVHKCNSEYGLPQSWLLPSQPLRQDLSATSSPPPPTLPPWRSGTPSLLAGLPPVIVPSHAHCVCGSGQVVCAYVCVCGGGGSRWQVVLREVGEGDTAHCRTLLSNSIFELE